MSWSFNAIGKPAAVAKKAAEELTRFKCYDPEEAIKANVGAAIAGALAAFPPDYAVRVTASGSQNGSDSANVVNTLHVQIEPLYGFVE